MTEKLKNTSGVKEGEDMKISIPGQLLFSNKVTNSPLSKRRAENRDRNRMARKSRAINNK